MPFASCVSPVCLDATLRLTAICARTLPWLASVHLTARCVVTSQLLLDVACVSDRAADRGLLSDGFSCSHLCTLPEDATVDGLCLRGAQSCSLRASLMRDFT